MFIIKHRLCRGDHYRHYIGIYGAGAMHTQLVEKGVVFKRHHLNYIWGRKLCAA
jgi:hypothetical protein